MDDKEEERVLYSIDERTKQIRKDIRRIEKRQQEQKKDINELESLSQKNKSDIKVGKAILGFASSLALGIAAKIGGLFA